MRARENTTRWLAIRRSLAAAALALSAATAARASPPWPMPLPSDSVTGKGWLARPGGDKARFDFDARTTDDGRWTGHLQYVDPGARLKLHSTEITAYSRTGADTRDLCGYAATNSDGRVAFHLRVSDKGGAGTFVLRLGRAGLVVYTTERDPKHTLGGGNIVLHPGSGSKVSPRTEGKCEI